MTLVVGACAHGSPGVTTSLLLAASLWPETATVPVVVEADASGGVIAARYEIGATPGFVTLAESMRKSESPPLLDHAQRLPSGVAAVAMSPSASAALTQLRSAGPFLGSYLKASDHPVVIDAGVMLPDSKLTGTLAAADLMVWFVRPTREELLVLRHRLAECAQPEHVAIVLVGATPYDAPQVEDALETEVLHTLPIDSRAATALNFGGDDRYLRRSQLARSCAALAQKLSLQSWLNAVGPAHEDPIIAGSMRDVAPGEAVPAVAVWTPHVESTLTEAAPLAPPPPPPEVAVWAPETNGSQDDFADEDLAENSVDEVAENLVDVAAADSADGGGELDDADDGFTMWIAE